MLPGAGYGLGINALEISGGVTIYGHGSGGVSGYLAGVFFMRDIERQLVTSFIASRERSVPDYGADLSLVRRPVRYE